MNFKILVIIVTYNGKPWIKKCLDSLAKSTCQHDIILVDNCSTDDSISYVEQHYNYIKIIKTADNLGFGMANNIGFAYAIENAYDYVLLLNQDVYVEADMISKLVFASKTNPEYGILSPLQLTGDGKEFDKNFYHAIKNKVSPLDSLTDIRNSDVELLDVKFVMAAIWFVSIDVVKDVGGFSPLFSHYGEDNDYANRILFHNKKIGVSKLCAGYHDRNFRELSDDKWLYIYGYVRYLYILSNINNNLLLSFLHFLYLFIGRSVQIIIKGRFKLLDKNLRYFGSIISNLNRIFANRKLTKRKTNSFLNDLDLNNQQ